MALAEVHTFRSRTLSSSANGLLQALPRRALRGAEALALGRLPSYWIETGGSESKLPISLSCWMTAILLFDWKLHDFTFGMRLSYLPVPAVNSPRRQLRWRRRSVWNVIQGKREGFRWTESFAEVLSKWDRKNAGHCKSTEARRTSGDFLSILHGKHTGWDHRR